MSVAVNCNGLLITAWFNWELCSSCCCTGARRGPCALFGGAKLDWDEEMKVRLLASDVGAFFSSVDEVAEEPLEEGFEL